MSLQFFCLEIFAKIKNAKIFGKAYMIHGNIVFVPPKSRQGDLEIEIVPYYRGHRSSRNAILLLF